MSVRVLVTGANGFIGNTFLRMVSDGPLKIFPLVRRPSNLKNEIIADLSDPMFCKILNGLPEVDVVVHLGARIIWGGSSREELYRPNVVATAELADWAARAGAYFVFASTALIAGAKNQLITKETVPNLDTDYGYSKWLAEEMIRMSGVEHAILRIAGVFGKTGPEHLGINRAINCAIRKTPPVRHGSGSIRRNYIYVKDVCYAIKYCIDNRIQGTHLLAGSQDNTVLEMLQAICDILLPGADPKSLAGEDGADQIIEHSEDFPPNRSFAESIRDIENDKTPIQTVNKKR